MIGHVRSGACRFTWSTSSSTRSFRGIAPSTTFDYFLAEQIVSYFLLPCVSNTRELYPVIAFTGIHSHCASAHVILGLGLGPAICPLSDSGKGASGGPLLRLSGGEQIARPGLLFFSELEAHL